jgi:hypothetical protein
MVFVTATEFGRMLKARHGDAIGTQRADAASLIGAG